MPVRLHHGLERFESICRRCGGRSISRYDIETDTLTTRLVDPDDTYCEDCYKESNREFTTHVQDTGQ